MATPTYSEFIEDYPELASTDDQARIERLLVFATKVVGDLMFDDADTVKMARIALAAHFHLLYKRGNKHGGDGVGQVTSRTNGQGASVSYAQVQAESKEDAKLLTTYAGVTFVTLKQTSARAALPWVVC